MNKLVRFLLPLFTMLLALLFAGRVMAAVGDVSVKIQTPKTPTRHNELNINFVALDIQDRSITARCYKKGPADGGFVQFGADINLIAGGNTDNCVVTSSLMDQQGSYQFYVTATAGGDTATSQTVTVDYNTSGPGTPTDYQKSLENSCQYKIHFKTADDSGKTAKVEVYRSENTSFTADGGTRASTVTVGSNTEQNVFVDKPDCNKDYYFAVRAFDSAGNGSGIVGDNATTVTTTTTTAGVSPAPAIIALSSEVGTGGPSETTEEGQAADTEIGPTLAGDETGEVLGTETTKYPWWKLAGFGLLALLLIGYAFRKFKRARA